MASPINVKVNTNTDSYTKEVAILLAVYNGTEWIEEQVQSILNQQSVNLSLFISIDPSDDHSEQWCRDLANKKTRIHIVERGTSLRSATQNFFNLLKKVDLTHFDYVGFADQDDIWCPEKIQSAIQALDSNHADGYSSNVEAFWESGQIKLINKAQKQTRWDHFFEAAGPGCTYVMSNRLVHAIKARLQQNKDLCEKIHFHDWFCYALARELGFNWFIDSNSYLKYRQHNSNVVGANLGLQAFVIRAKKVLSGDAIKQSQTIINVLSSDPKYKAGIALPKSRLDYLKLAFLCRYCRRRLKDKLFFCIFCVIMSIYKKTP